MAFTAAQLTDLQTIPHLLPLFRWRLWKQKVTTPWCAHTHARAFFWNVKMSIHIFPSSSVPYFPKAYCTFTTALLCPITIALSFFHYRIIMFPLSSHSPSSFALDDYLCYACTLRPLSRNSDTFTLQNKHTIKKNLHFSSIFSLFLLISSHIHIGAYPFSAPSIIYFHGESQTNISFPTSSVLTLE